MNEAYNNIVLAKHHLKINDLTNAVRYAKLAFAASEAAFFDPSLLALLYFPDDQKYVFVSFLFECNNYFIFLDKFQICDLHSTIFTRAAANYTLQS